VHTAQVYLTWLAPDAVFVPSRQVAVDPVPHVPPRRSKSLVASPSATAMPITIGSQSRNGPPRFVEDFSRRDARRDGFLRRSCQLTVYA
jgi:hypothetical protein